MDDPTAPPPKKRQLSCLGKGVISLVDGGLFGAAIGGVMASAQGISALSSGTENVRGAVLLVARSAWRSAASLGMALAGYTGGVCSLERLRGRRDAINPFFVGGLMGAIGSITRVEVHDGQTQRRVFAVVPRNMMAGALSSGALCTLFWYMQQPSRRARDEEQQAASIPTQTPVEPGRRPIMQSGQQPPSLPQRTPPARANASVPRRQVEDDDAGLTSGVEISLTDGQVFSSASAELAPFDGAGAPTPSPPELVDPRAGAPAGGGESAGMLTDGQLRDPWAK
jgi:hypothetical protein